VQEEAREIAQELETKPLDHQCLTEEVGDLLFTCVNLARFVGVDAETALSRANHKFERRFRRIETELEARGSHPETASLEEMDALWEQIKARERSQ